MSHFTEIKTEFHDVDTLVEALVAMGYTRSHIEVHREGAAIIDYQGKNTRYRFTDHQDERFRQGDRGHVIIRRQNVGQSCNDMGWYCDAEKGSVAFICDYSRSGNRCYNPKARALGGHTDAYLKKLADEYAAARIIKQAKDRGKRWERVEEGNRIRVYVGA